MSKSTYDSPEDEGFFGAIGRLAISWAHLEFTLDAFVFFFHHASGDQKIDREMPRALQRKITYLRAAFKRLKLPPDAAAGFQSFLDQVEKASEERHNIIHGIVVEQAERSGEASMVRLIREKDSFTKKHFKRTTRDILTAAVHVQNLGGNALSGINQLYQLVQELAKRPDAQKPS